MRLGGSWSVVSTLALATWVCDSTWRASATVASLCARSIVGKNVPLARYGINVRWVAPRERFVVAGRRITLLILFAGRAPGSAGGEGLWWHCWVPMVKSSNRILDKGMGRQRNEETEEWEDRGVGGQKLEGQVNGVAKAWDWVDCFWLDNETCVYAKFLCLQIPLSFLRQSDRHRGQSRTEALQSPASPAWSVRINRFGHTVRARRSKVKTENRVRPPRSFSRFIESAVDQTKDRH